MAHEPRPTGPGRRTPAAAGRGWDRALARLKQLVEKRLSHFLPNNGKNTPNKLETQTVKPQDFSITLNLDKTPAEVFRAVSNPRGWWSERIEGGTEKINDEFHYRYKDAHTCTMKLTDVVADRKMVWLVTQNYFSFASGKDEWLGTHVRFEITPQGDKTQLRFTHEGLVPEVSCYDACSKGWTQFVRDSLSSLINTGKGQPLVR